MKRHLFTIITWSVLNGSLFADSSLTTKVSRMDGLPARLLKAGGVDRDLLSGAKSMDLAPALKAMGCAIEDGETILYHAPSGTLLRNLSEENNRIVDEIVENLYRTDNLLAAFRVYIDLFEPLSGEERLKVVRRVGFLPDALVSSLVAESSLAKDDRGRQDLDRKTLALLDVALDRMKRQIEILETPEAGQSAPSGRH